MRRVSVLAFPVILLAACDSVGSEPTTFRSPALDPPSFQVSNTGVEITELLGMTSWATDINEAGHVVGMGEYWRDGVSGGSFLWVNGVVTDLAEIAPQAINDSGQIVGACSAGACIWKNGSLNRLGPFHPSDINNAGQVVGSGTSGGVLWHNGVVTSLGSMLPAAINEVGQIAGSCGTHACLWENGAITDLGTLGGTSSIASDINNPGQVVGTSTTATGSSHGFLWANGEMRDLGHLGQDHSEATAINDAGQVAGFGRVTGPNDDWGEPVVHPFVWTNGTFTDLGNFSDALSYYVAVAAAINEAGQVVGYYTGHIDSEDRRAVRWHPQPGNTAPVVSASPDQQVEVGQAVSVTFTFTDATPEGPWTWYVGWGEAGAMTEMSGLATTSSDPLIVTHTYTEWRGGTFPVRVRVTDARGGVGLDEVIVTVNQPANNTAPTVTAGGDQQGWPGALVGVSFTFADSTRNGPWAWQFSFGDGVTASYTTETTGEIGYEYRYAAAGRYTVRLTVTDGSGATGWAELTVTILTPPDGNTAPTVSAFDPPVPLAGDTVYLNALNNDKATPNGPWAWTIAWGDGASTTGEAGSADAIVSSRHVYPVPGQYLACITVRDAAGAAGSDDVIITIRANTAPIVDAGPDQQAEIGRRVDTPFSFTDATPTTFWSFHIDWGDGTVSTDAWTIRPNELNGAHHTYAAAGRYSVVITVTDQFGVAGTDTLVVWVGPRWWVATMIEHVSSLVATGTLTQEQADGLLAELRKALAKLDGGHTQPAINQLEAFIREVEALMRRGVLAPEQGQALIQAARGTIGQLGSKGGR